MFLSTIYVELIMGYFASNKYNFVKCKIQYVANSQRIDFYRLSCLTSLLDFPTRLPYSTFLTWLSYSTFLLNFYIVTRLYYSLLDLPTRNSLLDQNNSSSTLREISFDTQNWIKMYNVLNWCITGIQSNFIMGYIITIKQV